MDYHGILLRQLKHALLNEKELPLDIEKWHNFLTRVNRTYLEFDQDRYTRERTEEIVSREMQTLIDDLNHAQEIAHLGSWHRNLSTGQGSWSAETYRLFNQDPALGSPDFEKFITLIHPEDQKKLQKTLDKALKNGQPFTLEIRIPINNNTRWILANGIPFRDNVSNEFVGFDGTCLDITKIKEAEAYTEALHKELVTQSRKAGMADVATSVLHNIGNILNSVNVLTAFLGETLEKSELRNFSKTVQILNNNKLTLGSFFTDHPQGKHLLEFLNLLSEAWIKDQKSMLLEISVLNNHIEHIKNIVSAQQSLSGSKGMAEATSITILLEDAIMISGHAENRQDEIEIIRSYDYTETLLVDKTKLSQILVNLLRNARDAVNEYPDNGRKIFIRTYSKDNFVYIEVQDTGIGIEQQKLTQIFAHGFTTKKNGHGFGLHISALAAREMGGDLQVQSEGIGKGAMFIVKLPEQQDKDVKSGL